MLIYLKKDFIYLKETEEGGRVHKQRGGAKGEGEAGSPAEQSTQSMARSQDPEIMT